MSQAEVVLLACYRLSPAANPVCVFDLTVRAWTLDKERLGLPGFRQWHPDSKAVSTLVQYLLGRHTHGGHYSPSPKLAERCGRNLIRLTDLGVAKARRLEKSLAREAQAV